MLCGGGGGDIATFITPLLYTARPSPEPCCLPHSPPLSPPFLTPPPPPRWIDEDTLLPEATKHADSIIKAGMQQLPNNPFMIILYSSFLIDVQGSYQSGYAQLQTAKKADPR